MSDLHKPYIEAFRAFESSLNGQAGQPVYQVRRGAIGAFEANGFPTSRDEAWKSVNLSLLTEAFEKAPKSASGYDIPSDLLPEDGNPLLVFVDGHFDASASRLDNLPDGLTVVSIAKILESDGESLAGKFASVAPFEDHSFTALNTAFLADGALVQAARGAAIETPVHVIYASTGQSGTVTYPRSLFIAEENSQLTVVESFVGPDDADYLTNHVTEIDVADSAILDHYKIGLEGADARHVSNQQSRQGKASVLRSHSISLGGRFVRNDVSSALDGDGCESTINGLYVLDGDQHCDNYTLLDHRRPDCPSHELYKGILADSSRAIFRGKIHVHQVAQNTDAYQQNQNVLLSDDARIDTKPQLEIYADEVKCSHGATIGQIDDDAMFYLQARGISRLEAHKMLLEAFANDILSRIKIESVRATLTDRVLDKITLAGNKE